MRKVSVMAMVFYATLMAKSSTKETGKMVFTTALVSIISLVARLSTMGTSKMESVMARAPLLLPGGSIRYKGSWKAARFQGDGVLYYPDSDGILYEGEFKNGLPNGHGKFYHENGNLRCLGSFQEGKLHGVAKCYDQEGRLEYDGSHDNGLAHGLGKAYTPEDGNLLYEGEFKWYSTFLGCVQVVASKSRCVHMQLHSNGPRYSERRHGELDKGKRSS